MPLILTREHYVLLPLEQTNMQAWQGMDNLLQVLLRSNTALAPIKALHVTSPNDLDRSARQLCRGMGCRR